MKTKNKNKSIIEISIQAGTHPKLGLNTLLEVMPIVPDYEIDWKTHRRVLFDTDLKMKPLRDSHLNMYFPVRGQFNHVPVLKRPDLEKLIMGIHSPYHHIDDYSDGDIKAINKYLQKLKRLDYIKVWQGKGIDFWNKYLPKINHSSIGLKGFVEESEAKMSTVLAALGITHCAIPAQDAAFSVAIPDGDERIIRAIMLISTEDGPILFDNIHKLTDQTTAEGVYASGATVTKVYTDEKSAQREIIALGRLAHNDKVAYFISKMIHKINSHHLHILHQEDPIASEVLFNHRYLPVADKYLVFTDAEFSSRKMTSLERSGKSLLDERNWSTPRMNNRPFLSPELVRIEEESKQHVDKQLKLASSLMGINLRYSPLTRRMSVLAGLHTMDKDDFTDEEVKILGEKYHDYSLDDLLKRLKLPSHLKTAYYWASRRQEKLFKEKKHLFTHGDAKYDNWAGFVLIDFGSAKFSTEYKDIAKSLLDCTAIMDWRLGDDFFTGYNDTKEEFKPLIGALYEQVISPDGLLGKKIQSLSGQAFRIYKRIKEDATINSLASRLVKGAITIEEFMSGYESKMSPLFSYGSPKQLDLYINLYAHFRKDNGFPITDDYASFHNNVYDALVTESIRTAYYKSVIPGNEKIASEMIKIAELFAR